jgi:predicted aspartyl protease
VFWGPLTAKAMDWKHIVCLGYFLTAITSVAAHDWIGKLTAALPPIVGTAAAATSDEVRLENQGGTYAVPVWINRAITLKFVLDSGASDVLIPADVFLTLLRTGTVSESDFLDSKIYSLADGSKLKGARFVIRELRVGNQVATDVVASVGPVTGDLLLGLSFLSRFGTVTLDNDRHVLILSGKASAPLEAQRGTDEQAAVIMPARPERPLRDYQENPIRPIPVPDTTAPNSVPSQVRWYQGMDAPGNDLGGRAGWMKDVASADECMRICLSKSNCTGFTYNIRYSVCIPKSRIAPLINAVDPAITGVIRDRAEAPSAVGTVAAGVREYPDMDAPGHDRGSWVPNVSSEDCKKICLADNGCVGYTYNRRQLACFPKNSIGHLYPSSEPAVTGIIEGRN